MEKEVKNWCLYCKNEIYEGDAFVIDGEQNHFHPDCFTQIHTYTGPYSEIEEEYEK